MGFEPQTFRPTVRRANHCATGAGTLTQLYMRIYVLMYIPQGTVLAPFLFATHTADCRGTDESCPVVKFADDTDLVGKISNDEHAIYHKQIKNFVNWCDKNYL